MDDENENIFVEPSFSFSWKIPDFFTQLIYELSLKSPNFEFCGEQWHLEMQRVSFDIQTLVLVRNDISTCHDVFYCLHILCNDGQEYELVKSKFEFGKLLNECDVYNFDRRVLLQDENKILPDGTLNISCTLKCHQHLQAMTSVTTQTSNDDSNEEETNDKLKKEDDISNPKSDVTPTVIGNEKSNEETADDESKEDDSISSPKPDVVPIIIGSDKLLLDMEALFLSEQDSDAILNVGDRKFAVHRAILSARSPVFGAMFSHNMVESTTGEVDITGFEPDVFQDFLLYLYSARVKKLSEENVVGLYFAADKYNTQDLKEKCVQFMRDNLTVTIFCRVVSLALQHDESDLLEVAMQFFINNLKEIILTVEWQVFLKENPTAANELLIKASDFYVPPKKEQ